MRQYSLAFLCMSVVAFGGITGSAAEPVAVGAESPGGGALVPAQPGAKGLVLENSFEAGPESAGAGTKAVSFGGCVAPFRSVSHRVVLPAGGSFRHAVFPDRRGFNVVMTINYPGLFRRVNNFGPGRSEAFTVRTPSGRVRGTVTISGVRGSFGCYTLRVTP